MNRGKLLWAGIAVGGVLLTVFKLQLDKSMAHRSSNGPLVMNEVKYRNDVALLLEVASKDIRPNGPILARFQNSSPEIHWGEGMSGAKSVVIVVEDKDSPGAVPDVLWMVANIPAHLHSIPASARSRTGAVLGLQAVNSEGVIGYTGPRPTPGSGVHHYHFEVMTLDTKLKLLPGFSRRELIAAADKHLLSLGDFVGTFEAR